MNTNLIVAFAGRIGAGKSSVSAAFAEDLGWKFASFGGFVRKTATSRGMEHSRESLQAIGAELEAKDAAMFCRAVLDDAGWNAGEPVVVEGIRHVRILEALKSLVAPQPVFLVYLEAPEELRRARLQERGVQEAHYLNERKRTPPNGTSLPNPTVGGPRALHGREGGGGFSAGDQAGVRVRSVGIITGPVLCLCSIYLRRMAQCGVRENSIAREYIQENAIAYFP